MAAKNWYFAICSGFIEPKHIKNFRPTKIYALWVYLYCHKYANRDTGILIRKAKTIANELQFCEQTVRRNLRWLKKNNILNLKGNRVAMKSQFLNSNRLNCLWKTLWITFKRGKVIEQLVSYESEQ